MPANNKLPLQQFVEELIPRKFTLSLYPSAAQHQMFEAPRSGRSVVSRSALGRIGHDILPLDVPLAGTAQLSKAISLSVINAFGYNASINQTIVGGLVGVGSAVARDKLDRKVLRNIVLNWTLSPLLGLSSAALASLTLHIAVGG